MISNTFPILACLRYSISLQGYWKKENSFGINYLMGDGNKKLTIQIMEYLLQQLQLVLSLDKKDSDVSTICVALLCVETVFFPMKNTLV